MQHTEMAEPDQTVERDPVEHADDDKRDPARGAQAGLATAEPEPEPDAPEADDGWTPV
jgi:hypothetical protein